MLKGFDEKGNLQDVLVTEDGAITVAMEGGDTRDVVIDNTTENPIPIDITNEIVEEKTLNASVQTVGTTASTIAINKTVTTIDIANYSDTANVTVGIGTSQYVIGNNIATTLTINENVENILLEATEDNTKVQIVVKGVK